jgi:hypothetical protein
VGILLKLEFIRINFSSTGSQSITCSLELVTGTPRYFIGQTPVAELWSPTVFIKKKKPSPGLENPRTPVSPVTRFF